MSRQLSCVLAVVAMLAPAAARDARADDAMATDVATPRWAPGRAGLSAMVGVPIDEDLALMRVSLLLARQFGGPVLRGGTGGGPVLAYGGELGFGLYEDLSNQRRCEDEVLDDGSKRWTCGRLDAAFLLAAGWSWGAIAKSGLVQQEHTLLLRVSPYLGVGKTARGSFLATGTEARLGYFSSFWGFEAVVSDGGDGRYVGLGISIARGLGEDGRVVQAAAEPAVAAPPLHLLGRWRVDLAGGVAAPVREGERDDRAESGFHLAVYRVLTGADDRSRRATWLGLGGTVTLARPVDPLHSRDSLGDLGPSLVVGTSSLRDGHQRFSLYGRVAPVLGWRIHDNEDLFSYGARGALGLAFGIPENFLEDDLDAGPRRISPAALTVELTSAWLRHTTFVGAQAGFSFW